MIAAASWQQPRADCRGRTEAGLQELSGSRVALLEHGVACLAIAAVGLDAGRVECAGPVAAGCGGIASQLS